MLTVSVTCRSLALRGLFVSLQAFRTKRRCKRPALSENNFKQKHTKTCVDTEVPTRTCLRYRKQRLKTEEAPRAIILCARSLEPFHAALREHVTILLPPPYSRTKYTHTSHAKRSLPTTEPTNQLDARLLTETTVGGLSLFSLAHSLGYSREWTCTSPKTPDLELVC